MSDRLFETDDVPEIPILPEPRVREGAARGVALDSRFQNDYPPEWDCCTTCGGGGTVGIEPVVYAAPGVEIVHGGKPYRDGARIGGADTDWATFYNLERVGQVVIERPPRATCPDCLGMGSLKARVRLEAGHRCVRCKHPYMPKGDASALGVGPSGLHECSTCDGCSDDDVPDLHLLPGADSGLPTTVHRKRCPDCKGAGQVWTGWSKCDEKCEHGGPWKMTGDTDWKLVILEPYVRTTQEALTEANLQGADLSSWEEALRFGVEAEWRVLTVHHLDGDKANCRWWNLAALCQRCHLEIQAKVVMERVYPFEHSEWFKDFVAGYYAWVYLKEDLTREQVQARRDELLGLERIA